jgi:hypothetical protein
MPSNLLVIAATASLAFLVPAAFATESDSPLSDINDSIVVLQPQVDAHTICLRGFSTIECRSFRVFPDLEDCPAGESLIAVRAFGYLRHVCVPAK